MMKHQLLVLLAAAIACAPAIAHADPRHDAIEQAKRARAAGNHEEALKWIRTADAMQPNSSLRRFMTEELRDLGRQVEAYVASRDCIRLADEELANPALTPQAKQNSEAVRAGCVIHESELQKEIALVRLVPPSPAPPGLTVSINDGPAAAVPSAPVPMKPGKLQIRARAEGHTHFDWTTELRPSTQVEVSITMQPLPPQPTGSAPKVEFAPQKQDPPSRTTVTLTVPEREAPFRPAPYIVLSAGVAALLGAGAIALVQNGRYDDLKTQCPTRDAPTCPADKDARRDSIETMDTVSYVMAGVGGAVAVTGVVWLVLDSRRAPKTTGLLVGPSSIGYRAAF